MFDLSSGPSRGPPTFAAILLLFLACFPLIQLLPQPQLKPRGYSAMAPGTIGRGNRFGMFTILPFLIYSSMGSVYSLYFCCDCGIFCRYWVVECKERGKWRNREKILLWKAKWVGEINCCWRDFQTYLLSFLPRMLLL